MIMIVSETSLGRAVWNRMAPPNSAARSPTSGLRSRTLNGPRAPPRSPANRWSIMTFCSGVISSYLSGLNRSPTRTRLLGSGACFLGAGLEEVWALANGMRPLTKAQRISGRIVVLLCDSDCVFTLSYVTPNHNRVGRSGWLADLPCGIQLSTARISSIGMRIARDVASMEPSVAGKRLLPWLVAVAFFMESLDTTILNTAVPTIAAALKVAPLSMKSVLSSYTLSLAVFIPISGWMADRFGTRRIFGSAIAIFTLGSLLCGLSTNVDILVACRILQGCGGAMMVPVGRL